MVKFTNHNSIADNNRVKRTIVTPFFDHIVRRMDTVSRIFTSRVSYQRWIMPKRDLPVLAIPPSSASFYFHSTWFFNGPGFRVFHWVANVLEAVLARFIDVDVGKPSRLWFLYDISDNWVLRPDRYTNIQYELNRKNSAYSSGKKILSVITPGECEWNPRPSSSFTAVALLDTRTGGRQNKTNTMEFSYALLHVGYTRTLE